MYVEFFGQWNKDEESKERYREKKKIYHENNISCLYFRCKASYNSFAIRMFPSSLPYVDNVLGFDEPNGNLTFVLPPLYNFFLQGPKAF